MATGRVNVGGSSRLNLFTQMSEPATKEGIWLQCNDISRDTEVDNRWWVKGEMVDLARNVFADIPYEVQYTSAVTDGNYIYILGGSVVSGGSWTSGSVNFYRYDKTNNQWIQLANMPASKAQGNAILYNNKIYYVGGNAGTYRSNTFYVYDIAANSWSQLPNLPTYFQSSLLLLINNEMYMIGGPKQSSGSFYSVINYKYNFSTGVWTRLADVPVDVQTMLGFHLNGVIYCFWKTSIYKYDIVNNTWSTISSPINADYPNRGVVYNNEFYVFGKNSSYIDQAYKYTPSTNTWIAIKTMPMSNYNDYGMVITNDNLISLLGGSSYTTKNRSYGLTSKVYNDKSIVLERLATNLFQTELSTPIPTIKGTNTRLVSGFNNAFLYTNGNLERYPAYYGDGTQWIKFRN